jgi:hypothetical protein
VKEISYIDDGLNLADVRARLASIIAVATVGDRQIEEQCQHLLWVPAAKSVTVE